MKMEMVHRLSRVIVGDDSVAPGKETFSFGDAPNEEDEVTNQIRIRDADVSQGRDMTTGHHQDMRWGLRF
jgi:hypothetical protein